MKKTFLERGTIHKSLAIQRKNLFYHFRYCKPTQCTELEHTQIAWNNYVHLEVTQLSWVKQVFFKLCATHARSESLQWHWLSPERLHMVLLSTSCQMPG